MITSPALAHASAWSLEQLIEVLHVETQRSLLVLLALTVVFIVGQAVAGHHVHNQELTQHGCAPIDLWHYLATGHFVSATFENWESEFLQMGMYVLPDRHPSPAWLG